MPEYIVHDRKGQVWHIADGWKEETEAREHKSKLAAAHPDKTFRVYHSTQHAFGGGHWLVVYR